MSALRVCATAQATQHALALRGASYRPPQAAAGQNRETGCWHGGAVCVVASAHRTDARRRDFTSTSFATARVASRRPRRLRGDRRALLGVWGQLRSTLGRCLVRGAAALLTRAGAPGVPWHVHSARTASARARRRRSANTTGSGRPSCPAGCGAGCTTARKHAGYASSRAGGARRRARPTPHREPECAGTGRRAQRRSSCSLTSWCGAWCSTAHDAPGCAPSRAGAAVMVHDGALGQPHIADASAASTLGTHVAGRMAVEPRMPR